MKVFSALLLFAISFSFAQSFCHVAEKRKVVCKFVDKDDLTVIVSTISEKGKWNTKVFEQKGEDSKSVTLYEHNKVKDTLGIENLVERGLPANVDELYRLLLRSNRIAISSLHCVHDVYLTSFKYDRITGLKTDRRDYDLRHKKGTYCEDFLASGDLFWEPPK